MKKQVYKVEKCGCTKNIVRLTCRVHGLLAQSLKPKKSIKKYCGGDHCTMLWNLPCSEDHGLPKKSKKKMEKGVIGKRTGIKSRKLEIMELRDKGLTMRQIASKLGLKAHSVVAHYLKDQPPQKRIPLIKLSELLPKKRYPILEKDEVDGQSNAMTAGWNAYRDELLKIIYSL